MQRKSTYGMLSGSVVFTYRFTVNVLIVLSLYLICPGAHAVSAELIWSAKTGAAISDSPLVQDDRIYAASADKHLYCWDATSGEELWKIRFKQRLYYSPVYSDGDILVAEPFSTGILHSVNAVTGNKEWSTRIGKEILKPVVLDGKIIVASGKRLTTLHIADGSVVERAVTEDNISSITIWNSHLIVVTIQGDLKVYDSGLGLSREIALGQGGVFLYPSDGFIYVTVSTGATYKITPDWEIVWESEYGLPVYRNPIKSGDYVYSIAEGGFILIHLDETGELVTEIEIPDNVFAYSSFSDGLVLVSELGTMYFVNRGTLRTIECDGIGSDFYAPISVSGDNVYFSNSIGFLYSYRVRM